MISLSDLRSLASDLAATLNIHHPSAPGFAARRTSLGDHTGKATPVPIPNTEVKLSGPMIVPTSAKVGIARFLFFYAARGLANMQTPPTVRLSGVFACAAFTS